MTYPGLRSNTFEMHMKNKPLKAIVCATFAEQKVIELLLDHLHLPGYLCGTINYAIRYTGLPLESIIPAFDIIPKLNKHAVDTEPVKKSTYC